MKKLFALTVICLLTITASITANAIPDDPGIQIEYVIQGDNMDSQSVISSVVTLPSMDWEYSITSNDVETHFEFVDDSGGSPIDWDKVFNKCYQRTTLQFILFDEITPEKYSFLIGQYRYCTHCEDIETNSESPTKTILKNDQSFPLKKFQPPLE